MEDAKEAHHVDAVPRPRADVHEPDGSEVQVRGSGDQFHAVFETPDGYTVTKDPDTGFFQYARLSDSGDELIPTGVNVNGATPVTELGLEPGLRVPPAVAKQQALARAAEGPQRRWQGVREEKLAELRGVSPLSRAEAAPAPAGTVGTYVGLCLLVQFPDVPATIPQAEVDNYCNQVGYSGFGNNGSVRDYFADVSEGKLTYTNVVTAYYTAAHNRALLHRPHDPVRHTRASSSSPRRSTHLVASGFDFSATHCSDSGGFIYALNVFYARPTVNNWSQGPLAALVGPGYAVRGRPADTTFSGLPVHRHGSAADARDVLPRERPHDLRLPRPLRLRQRVARRRRLLPDGLRRDGRRIRSHVDAYLKNAGGLGVEAVTPIAPGTCDVAAGQQRLPTSTSAARRSTSSSRTASRPVATRRCPDAGLAIWHVDEAGSNNNEQMTAGHALRVLARAGRRARFTWSTRSTPATPTTSSGRPGAPRFGADTTPRQQLVGRRRVRADDRRHLGARHDHDVHHRPSSSSSSRNFGYVAGSWRVDRHPRFMADTTGDGRADIVGFGDAGVYVSRAQRQRHASARPSSSSRNFGYVAGGWHVERHPRFMADTTGDGRADIVGFGDAGVYVSRAQRQRHVQRAAARRGATSATPPAGGASTSPALHG